MSKVVPSPKMPTVRRRGRPPKTVDKPTMEQLAVEADRHFKDDLIAMGVPTMDAAAIVVTGRAILSGDVRAAKEWLDRRIGKPIQTTETVTREEVSVNLDLNLDSGRQTEKVIDITEA